ncbi:hypothetical protein D3C86_1296510 [compost metagenome]
MLEGVEHQSVRVQPAGRVQVQPFISPVQAHYLRIPPGLFGQPQRHFCVIELQPFSGVRILYQLVGDTGRQIGKLLLDRRSLRLGDHIGALIEALKQRQPLALCFLGNHVGQRSGLQRFVSRRANQRRTLRRVQPLQQRWIKLPFVEKIL